jgi:hypothetical protein
MCHALACHVHACFSVFDWLFTPRTFPVDSLTFLFLLLDLLRSQKYTLRDDHLLKQLLAFLTARESFTSWLVWVVLMRFRLTSK